MSDLGDPRKAVGQATVAMTPELQADEAVGRLRKAMEKPEPIGNIGMPPPLFPIVSAADLRALLASHATLKSENEQLRGKVGELETALRPFANVVFNDNGDVTYDYSYLNDDHYWKAYHVIRRADAAARKEKDAAK